MNNSLYTLHANVGSRAAVRSTILRLRSKARKGSSKHTHWAEVRDGSACVRASLLHSIRWKIKCVNLHEWKERRSIQVMSKHIKTIQYQHSCHWRMGMWGFERGSCFLTVYEIINWALKSCCVSLGFYNRDVPIPVSRPWKFSQHLIIILIADWWNNTSWIDEWIDYISLN